MRKGLIITILPGAALSLGAQNSFVLPSAEETRAILDSTSIEAINLYIMERTAWAAEDCFSAHASRKDKFQGWIPRQGKDGSHTECIFYNLDDKTAIFEATVSVPEFSAVPNDTLRPLTERELYIIDKYRMCLDAAKGLGVSLSPPEGTTYNTEIFCYPDNTFRVFFMLGTSLDDVIPFGSDFSYDVDSTGVVTGFRAYHSGYLPVPTRGDDGQAVSEITMSHTELFPFISSTEIAQFLLYGYGFARLSSFSVYSAPLNCTFTYSISKGLSCDAYPDEEDEIYPVDWKKIKAAAKSRPDEIREIAAKLADPERLDEVSLQEAILGFYGMAVLSGLSVENTVMDAVKLYNGGNFADAFNKAKAALEKNCLNIRALLYAGFSAEALAKSGVIVGNPKDYINCAAILMGVIAETGYGDRDHPFCVTSVADEYDFMRFYLDLWKYDEQALVDYCLDKFILSEPSPAYPDKEIYFDATWPLEATDNAIRGARH